MCVKACTGSGKTLAYVLSMLQILKQEEFGNEVRGMILVPSWQLAKQVYDIVCGFSKVITDLKPHLSIGGLNIGEEVDSMNNEKPNILIGTVGRIWDLT